jgi:hypothetical protein
LHEAKDVIPGHFESISKKIGAEHPDFGRFGKLARHPRCPKKEEQEKNPAAGFNTVDAMRSEFRNVRENRASNLK